ncbi:hypothetical protein BY458DRAFT_508582 [Sporodiniella umbellata]|nr:hypothetical protein BY458DRAFT_508582 [Sporodiniella umbellata]
MSPLRKWEIRQLVKRDGDGLAAKVAQSPYARMLASPLRLCGYHNKIFPSKLLLRFGTGWHPETQSVWAFPTVGGKQEGRGYYINLRKKVMEVLKTGDIRKVFYGTAHYRVDMTDHVQRLLADESFKRFSSFSLNSFCRLEALGENVWQCPDADLDFQCVLVLDPDQSLCQLEGVIHTGNRVQYSVPCYNVAQLWTQAQLEPILTQLGPTQVALGVSKSLKTVDLAIDLWRCRKFAS